MACVHTLPWGKALASTNACNQSGEERRARREERFQEKKRTRKGQIEKEIRNVNDNVSHIPARGNVSRSA